MIKDLIYRDAFGVSKRVTSQSQYANVTPSIASIHSISTDYALTDIPIAINNSMPGGGTSHFSSSSALLTGNLFLSTLSSQFSEFEEISSFSSELSSASGFEYDQMTSGGIAKWSLDNTFNNAYGDPQSSIRNSGITFVPASAYSTLGKWAMSGTLYESSNHRNLTSVGLTFSGDASFPLGTRDVAITSNTKYGTFNQSGLPAGDTPRSICAWIKTSMTTDGAFFSYGSTALNTAVSLYVQTSTGYFGVSKHGSAALVSATAINTGTWKHVAMTYTGTTMKLYVDSVEVASGSVSLGTVVGTGPGYIGNYISTSNNIAMIGTIADVQMYDFALTAGEVSTIFGGSDITIDAVPFTADYVAKFNGSSSTATFFPNQFPPGANARTLCAWIRSFNTGEAQIFGYGTNSAGQRFQLWVGSNHKFSIEGYGGGYSVDSGITVNDGTWNHVAATYDGTNASVYVNAVFATSGAIAYNTVLTYGLVGSLASSYYFLGEMSDCRALGYAATSGEIVDIFNGTI